MVSLFRVHFVGAAEEEQVPAKPIQYIPPPPPHMVPMSSIPYRLPRKSLILHRSFI